MYPRNHHINESNFQFIVPIDAKMFEGLLLLGLKQNACGIPENHVLRKVIYHKYM
jgi:hypothetical protein